MTGKVEIDGQGRDVEAVHGRRMGDDHLAVVDQLLPIEVTDPFLPKIALQGGEWRGLGPRRGGFPASHISAIDMSMGSPKAARRAADDVFGERP